MSETNPPTKNRADRRAEAANARKGKPPDDCKVRAAFDETPTSPVGEREVTSITLIWERELCEQLGRSKWSIDRWIKSGRFPPPLAVTQQSRAWRVRDIEACGVLAPGGRGRCLNPHSTT
jgi:predicted DNA-binding transcriptional regulator AlpA